MSHPQKPVDLMPRLLEIAPAFRPLWEEHLAYWENESPGIYIDTSEFCRFVIDCYGRDDTEWFPSLFAMIEELIRNGSEEMGEIAILGLLETLQVQASHREHGEEVFLHWLGPRSREAWAQIDELWQQHGSLANIVRAEGKAD